MPCRLTLALVLALVPWGVASQENQFTAGENPYQDERPLKLGEPVPLNVEVAETQFVALALTPTDEVVPGKKVKCQLTLTGQRLGSSKAEVLPIFLLEDEAGQSLERISPAVFKVKGKKPFEFRDTVTVSGDALQAAAKIWIYLEVR